MKTLFERIILGEIPCDKVLENEKIIAFKDIAPKAPIHILIVPKKVIPDLQSMHAEDFYLLGEIASAAQEIAKRYNVVERGYRLVTNNGPDAGQIVFHLHFHFLAGAHLGRLC